MVQSSVRWCAPSGSMSSASRLEAQESAAEEASVKTSWTTRIEQLMRAYCPSQLVGTGYSCLSTEPSSISNSAKSTYSHGRRGGVAMLAVLRTS